MADIGINFRATSGYVTDGANETYCIGDVYPTTRGGITFGWDVLAGTVDQRDRDNTNDRRLAGINFTATLGRYFRIDLPAADTYDVHVAAGDASSGNPCEWQLQDTTTTFATLSGNTAINHFHDANNTDWSAAAWPGSETTVTQTFSTTQFRLRCNSSAGNNVIAHIRIVTSSGAAPDSLPWLVRPTVFEYVLDEITIHELVFSNSSLGGPGGGGPGSGNE